MSDAAPRDASTQLLKEGYVFRGDSYIRCASSPPLAAPLPADGRRR